MLNAFNGFTRLIGHAQDLWGMAGISMIKPFSCKSFSRHEAQDFFSIIFPAGNARGFKVLLKLFMPSLSDFKLHEVGQEKSLCIAMGLDERAWLIPVLFNIFLYVFEFVN